MQKRVVLFLVISLILLLVSTGAKPKPKISVAGTISVSPATITSSDSVTVSYSKSTEGNDAVIRLWDYKNSTLLSSEYENAIFGTSGKRRILAPRRTGQYTYRLYSQQTNELIAESNLLNVIEYSPTITVAPTTVKPGDSLFILIRGASGLRGSRFYIANADTDLEVPRTSIYRPGDTSNYATTAPSIPGNYVIKLTRDESDKVIGESNVINVIENTVNNRQSPTPEPTLPTTSPTKPTVIEDQPLNESNDSNLTIILTIGSNYMTINGVKKEIDEGRNTVPIIIEGRTLLPIRALVESMGGSVNWNESEQKVTIELDHKVVELWINKRITRVNGINKTIDVAPRILGGRTMIPVRFISENIGCEVKWEGTTSQVTIIKVVE